MINVEVVTLVLLKNIGAGDMLLSVDVCDPQHVDSVRDAEVERLGLTLLNAWLEDRRESVYAYTDGAGLIYQFRLINHEV
jgi:hypothetical protein